MSIMGLIRAEKKINRDFIANNTKITISIIVKEPNFIIDLKSLIDIKMVFLGIMKTSRIIIVSKATRQTLMKVIGTLSIPK